MNRTVLRMILSGAMLVSGAVTAKTLEVDLIMRGGNSRHGFLVGRDGDWVEFSKSSTAKPMRMGASTINELKFNVKLDTDKLKEMDKNLEYERMIAVLSRTLSPFSEYSDIPSNLTKYNTKLMELYYKVGQYDESLSISSKIALDDRNPTLQEKSRVYQALALIASGRADDAELLFAQYGWDQETSEDFSAAKLYVTAKLLSLKKEYAEAIELVATVIAFHSQDTTWMQPSELLCAELYAELGMYDSADEVIRQISILYNGTSEYNAAQSLKITVESLRATQELEESLESEES